MKKVNKETLVNIKKSIAIVICVGVIAYSVTELYKIIKEGKRNAKAIREYSATFPNYDDSIRLAKTDEELQNAINHREQVRLKIVHFADSLEHVKK